MSASIVARAGDVSHRSAGTGAAGDLDAWAAAVEHLHFLGLPAAVPEFAGAWLRRRAVRADWVYPGRRAA